MTLHQQNKFSLLDLSPWSDTARLHTFVPKNKRILLDCRIALKAFQGKGGKNRKERKVKQKIYESGQDGIDSFLLAPPPLNMSYASKDFIIPKN